MVGACASYTTVEVPVTTRSVELVAPRGAATVTVVDRAGAVSNATGEWSDSDPAGEDRVVLVAPSVLRVRWPGFCSETTELRVDRLAPSKIQITLDVQSAPRTDCRPRGYIPHVINLELLQSYAAQDVTYVDKRMGADRPPSTARPPG
jgi:hypothetical protein